MSAAAKGGARMSDEVLQAAGQSVAVGRVRRRRKRKLALGPHSISLQLCPWALDDEEEEEEEGSVGGATALSDNPILPFRIPRLNPPLVSANNPPSFFLSAIFALGMQ